jgi:hypothetical protein
MVIKVPTLSEQEKLDEEKLLKDIDSINQNLKEGNKKVLYDTVSKIIEKRHHSLKSLEASVSFNGISNISTAFGSNESYPDDVIAQNLKLEEVLKIIIIGDKGVGKSLFVDKACNVNLSLGYTPTIR